MDDIAATRQRAQSCRLCPHLAETRTRVVFGGVGGERDVRADLLIVGEAPGEDEDAAGKPFVGTSGRQLDKLMDSSGLDRATAYVTNVVKCRPTNQATRPPSNRRPRTSEVKNCRGYLDTQIGFVGPHVIIALGSTAVRRLLGPSALVETSRVADLSLGDCRVVATFHPAALNRQKGRRQEVANDFARARRLLEGSERNS